MKQLTLFFLLLLSAGNGFAQTTPTLSDLPKPIAIRAYRGNAITITLNLSSTTAVVSARARLSRDGALLPNSQQPVVNSGSNAATLVWSGTATEGMPAQTYVEIAFNSAIKIQAVLYISREVSPATPQSSTFYLTLQQQGVGLPIEVTLSGSGGSVPVVDAYTKSQTDNLLNAKANLANVPTNTSQLTNGAGFVTASGVRSTPLTGLSATITQGISATHTVLEGLGRAQGQINSITATQSTLTSAVTSLSTNLSSLSLVVVANSSGITSLSSANTTQTAAISSLGTNSATQASQITSLSTTASNNTTAISSLSATVGNNTTNITSTSAQAYSVVNSTTGTFGSSTAIPVIIVDKYGKVTNVTTTTFSAGGASTTAITSTTASATSYTLSFASAAFNYYRHTSTGNTTFTCTATSANDGSITILNQKIGSGGHTLTFSGVTWPGGVTPTFSTSVNTVTVFSFLNNNGSCYCTGFTVY